MGKLSSKKIALISTDGFEQSELFEPLQALKDAGATVDVISPKTGEITGWSNGNWGKSIKVDKTFEDLSAEDYDGLLIPGGTLNCDKLRQDEAAVDFVEEFFDANKPVAAICHGPQMLIEAQVVDGRSLTSYAGIQTDLENAGADWSDEEVVVDNGLVTSRTPKDLPAFIEKMIEEFAEGVHS